MISKGSRDSENWSISENSALPSQEQIHFLNILKLKILILNCKKIFHNIIVYTVLLVKETSFIKTKQKKLPTPNFWKYLKCVSEGNGGI